MPNSAPKFRFAVIADTHVIIEREADTSPYPVNGLATKRTKWVIEDLKVRNPNFVIHVGDMVRPFPSLPSFQEACAVARDTFAGLDCPIHFLPGNHDIGDKPIASAPAPTITQEFLEMYEAQFGDHFASFDSDDCHFVLLNASVINSGLAGEASQSAWLVEDLNAAAGRRIFVFIHYPPFLAVPDEASNYDNLDEPGRSWLLDLFAAHKVEALFAGHVHHFFYNHHQGADLYYLPSTSFARHDFSELFHLEPAAEYGRNDPGKLGYALVDVYDDCHIVRLIGSDGHVEAEAQHESSIAPLPVHPRERLDVPIGVQLRHAWNEIRALPYNNPLDEFTRKRVRNDYPILATWQIGLTYLRVPIDDLLDPNTRDRMAALRGMGQRFVVMHFGPPDAAMLDLFRACGDLIHAIEIILPRRWLKDMEAEIKRTRSRFDGLTYLAVLDSSADHVDGKSRHFGHSTKYGIHASHLNVLAELETCHGALIAAVDGLSFRIEIDDDIWTHIMAIEKAGATLGKSALIHVNNFNNSAAEAQFDDQLIANRTVLASIGAFALADGLVMLDNLMDIDRAHYPRHGLIDRRGNFRPAAHYLQNILSRLARHGGGAKLELGDLTRCGEWLCAEFAQGDTSYLVMLGTTPGPDEDWRSVLAAFPGYSGGTCLSAGASPAGDAHATGGAGLLFTLHR